MAEAFIKAASRYFHINVFFVLNAVWVCYWLYNHLPLIALDSTSSTMKILSGKLGNWRLPYK